MNDRTVLITGASGFLGRYINQHFSAQGWTVIGIDNVPTENAPLSDLSTYYSLKLPDAVLIELLRKHNPDVCIHCAGSASVGLSVTNPVRDFYTNTVLTFEVLNALRLTVPKCQFILLSSAAVYGNPSSLPVKETHSPAPISPYGFHKWQCEQLCQEFAEVYGQPTASLRIFSAYGPGLHRQVLWDICRKITAMTSLTLQGTGKESRDFIHALDIARAIHIVSSKAPMRGEVYNVASGQEVTIQDLANMVLEAFDSSISPVFDEVLPVGTPLNWCADISKLKSLGFSGSITLQQGVKSFANWCRAELKSV
jgi:UDP-glucose 4-epimerase